MNNQTIPLFSYGTLKRGFSNHTYQNFHKSKFITTDTIKGELYGKKGHYPILIEGEEDVLGEIFEVPVDIFIKVMYMELKSGYSLKKTYTKEKGYGVFYFFITGKDIERYRYFLDHPIKEWTLDLDKR